MLQFFRRFRKSPQQDIWSASVYFFDSTLLVHANNRTYNNYGWNSQPIATVSADASRDEIGSVVRRIVLASHWDAKTPDPIGTDSLILKASGVSSWRKFERNSKLVHVSLQDDQFLIVPNKAARRGEGEGFLALPETITVASNVDDIQLADAVFQGLNECISWESQTKRKADD